ncbi:Vitamin K epoxide reductase [Seminavis robusta]|uniref:Vitamin K epoxide reductase n=1 Tax=Seminavis robusta TaxID=568900 RepID=A0A9N8E5L8_9STRA|nr:Vitamin K epoxide reductase [Seminavis robusta]|eukprot:Sro573_g169050.1 Vitamin K epoxide reductase (250) ;mRNA; f:39592-40441
MNSIQLHFLLFLIVVILSQDGVAVNGFAVTKQPSSSRSQSRPSSSSSLFSHDKESIPFSEGTSRRRVLTSWIATTGISGIVMATAAASPRSAMAAPPIAVIAEELGYFPVQNKAGEMVYVPKRVQRQSSEQAIALAKKLKQAGVVMYGAFWCPHCARQKELFGREAWSYIDYVECAPKGYGAAPLLCNKQDIDGYPTWVFKGTGSNGRKERSVLGGERPLEDLAQQINIAFQPDKEENLPPSLGSSACK